ncbi:radical SAM family heme chaperone HemW, partial [Pectinatus frisingensis]|uniref:radical SAM family heme chaperone HemW n=1 Tax=Pectinatus frisingensis TaxID=865 RepID=UPI0018C7D267
MFSLYIHIPFCRQKCFYCDFPSIAANSTTLYNDYITAVIKEINLRRQILGPLKISTIYFGGGTPSLLPPESIGILLSAVSAKFIVSSDAEITLEANPGTVSLDSLQKLNQYGINRLSIGVQATQNNLLKFLGRIHNFKQVQTAVDDAKKAGLKNINLDLMYGLPSQSLKMLSESINWFLNQDIQHISIYGLQIEKGTRFAHMQLNNKLSLPNDELVEQMYDYITNTLPLHGFYRYEISNFAKPTFESRHNMTYWQDKPYLGIGCAAHSYYNQQRTYNTHNVYKYIKTCNDNLLPSIKEETLDRKKWMEEFCFLALRTVDGINKTKFKDTFNCNIYDIYCESINKLKSQHLLSEDKERLCLTPLGMKFGNT